MIRIFLTHGSNAALLAILVLWLVACAAGLCPPHPIIWLLGAATFLSGEDGFHRVILHAPPMRGAPFIRRLQHRLHYDHHLDPDRLDLLFLPPWLLAPGLALTAAFAAWIWPGLDRTASFSAGIVAATLDYEWTHFVAHRPYRPRTPWGRWLKRNHLRHHFHSEHHWFGVTNPALDLVLGTCNEPRSVARSATTRTLGMH